MNNALILTLRRYNELQRQAQAFPVPFEEDQAPRVSSFTAQEIATLQSRLDKRLGPEYVSTRSGPGGGKLHYLAGEKVIGLANEVFGFNGWSSEVRNVHIDFMDEREGKTTMSCTVIVRVTLKDGTYHEDIGCGSIENMKSKATAIQKVKKEAATDALKRALRNFGNVLGLCMYDKDYLTKVMKTSIPKFNLDEDNLYRHQSCVPPKKPATADTSSGEKGVPPQRASNVQPIREEIAIEYEEYDCLFSETDFDHPDEVHLDDTSVLESATTGVVSKQQHPTAQAQPTIPKVKSEPPIRQMNDTGPRMQNHQQQRQAGYARSVQGPNGVNHGEIRSGPITPAGRGMSMPSASNAGTKPHAANTNSPQQRPTPSANDSTLAHAPDVPINGAIGFVTGRAAEALTKSDTPTSALPRNSAFNPHAESPSIRRTTGIDHTTSTKVTHVEVQKAKGAPPPAHHNFVNPTADPARRIGMPPPAAHSPLANRGSYRPPGAPPAAVKRPALADVSNVAPQAEAVVEGPDAKKVKVGP